MVETARKGEATATASVHTKTMKYLEIDLMDSTTVIFWGGNITLKLTGASCVDLFGLYQCLHYYLIKWNHDKFEIPVEILISVKSEDW